MKKILALLLTLAFLPAVLSANETTKTKSISIFKNGTVFFEKEMTVNASKGSVQLGKLPFERENARQKVLFGTVWCNAISNTIKSIGVSQNKVKESKDADSMREILLANIGKKIEIKFNYNDKTLKGKIDKVLDDIVYIDGKDLWKAVKISTIDNIEFEKKPEMSYLDEIEKKVMNIEFEKNNSKQKLDIIYMQDGISWLPNYHIELMDGKKARIRLRANMMNDIEDIENVDVNFVVGVPTFMYSNQESPLTTDFDIRNFVGGFAEYGNAPEGIMSQSNFSNVRIDGLDAGEQFAPVSPEISGNEDLYLYKKQNISLKKGGRAFFDLLATEVEYDDLYSVRLNGRSPNRYNQPIMQENRNDVWHSIRFKNNTKVPFTTGTAFVSKKSKASNAPVSQNKLNYTPPKSKAEVKLTISPDIHVVESEKEISRNEKAKKFDYWNDLITMEGTIKIQNFKSEKINLKINRNISGELLECNVDWESKSLLKLSNVKNKLNDTTWELELGPGESKKIVYTYSIYVRR